MKYRNLGNSGVRISEIGMATEGGGLLANASEDQVRGAVVKALELGINYFEADQERYQSRLGSVLNELRLRPLIAVSIPITVEDLPALADRLEARMVAALERLKTDSLDFLNLGYSEFASSSPRSKGARLKANDFHEDGAFLDDLRKVLLTGHVRFLGLSVGGGDAEAVAALLRSGVFSHVSVVYNLLNPSALTGGASDQSDPDYGQIISIAAERNVGVVVRSPLAGGELQGESTAHSEATGDRDRDVGKVAAPHWPTDVLSVPDGESLAQTALRFTLTEPSVTTVLPELGDLDQLDKLVDAAMNGGLPESQMVKVGMIWRARGKAASSSYVSDAKAQTRSRRGRR